MAEQDDIRRERTTESANPILAGVPRTERHDELRGHVLAVYASVVGGEFPADHGIAAGLRTRKLGGGAARFVASATTALLRARIRTLRQWQWANRESELFPWPDDSILPPDLTPLREALVAGARWLLEGLSLEPEDAAGLLRSAAAYLPDSPDPAEAVDFIARVAADPEISRAPAALRDSALASIPLPILERWKSQFGCDEAMELAAFLSRPAPLDLRVNTLKVTREAAIERLQEAGFEAFETPISPDGVRLLEKRALNELELWKEGALVIQNEGSQIVSHALGVRNWLKVLDACAGGGGKTIHVATLMEGKGLISAHDTDSRRLESVKKRAAAAKLGNVRILEPGTAYGSGPFDSVLIDAPCSGLGTLRSSPDLQWRSGVPGRLREIAATQLQCLRDYAPLVKPGGFVVYATCTTEPEETTDVIERFLRENPEFAPDPLPGILRRRVPPEALSHGGAALTLIPSRDGTDGFFIARLTRPKVEKPK